MNIQTIHQLQWHCSSGPTAVFTTSRFINSMSSMKLCWAYREIAAASGPKVGERQSSNPRPITLSSGSFCRTVERRLDHCKRRVQQTNVEAATSDSKRRKLGKYVFCWSVFLYLSHITIEPALLYGCIYFWQFYRPHAQLRAKIFILVLSTS